MEATPVSYDLIASDEAYALKIQSDGKLVLAGSANSGLQFGVARLTSAGSLDPDFGENGVTSVFLTGSAEARDAAFQMVSGEQRIVVAGISSSGNAFGIIRLTSTGNLDTSFNATGKKEVSLTGSAGAYGIAVQANNKIVVAGVSGSGINFGVIRLNVDGSLDTAFGGGDGKVEIGLSGSAGARDVALQSFSGEQRILVAGKSSSGTAFGIIRLLPNGDPDPSFNVNGKREVVLSGSAGAYGIAVQPDNKIVVVGESRSGIDFGVIRLNAADGSLDTTFGGGDGKVETTLSGSAGARDVAIQQVSGEDRIVVAGHSSSGNAFGVIRLTSAGDLDSDFSSDGKTEFVINSVTRANAVAIQGTKILVAGGAGGSAGDFAIERLTTAGSSDTTFPSANSSPTITNVSNLAIDEDSETGLIPFTVGDAETPAGSLSLKKRHQILV